MSNPSVLVVDDDADTREVIADVLLDAGYAVRVADNGAAALTAMRDWPPGLVLLDLMMPQFDGWQVMFEMLRDPLLKPIPVCVVSAFSEKAPAVATERLQKPIKRAQLIEIAQKYCGPTTRTRSGASR